MRQRHKLRKRRRQRRRRRRWRRRRERRRAADRAGRVEAEPGVDAAEVEGVPAIRQQSEDLPLPVMVEADRANGLPFDFSVAIFSGSGGGSAVEGEFGVGVDDGFIESDAKAGQVVGVADLGDVEYAGEDHAAGGVVRVPAREAAVAAEEVEEEGGGKEDEDDDREDYSVGEAGAVEEVAAGIATAGLRRHLRGGGGDSPSSTSISSC